MDVVVIPLVETVECEFAADWGQFKTGKLEMTDRKLIRTPEFFSIKLPAGCVGILFKSNDRFSMITK